MGGKVRQRHSQRNTMTIAQVLQIMGPWQRDLGWLAQANKSSSLSIIIIIIIIIVIVTIINVIVMAFGLFQS